MVLMSSKSTPACSNCQKAILRCSSAVPLFLIRLARYEITRILGLTYPKELSNRSIEGEASLPSGESTGEEIKGMPKMGQWVGTIALRKGTSRSKSRPCSFALLLHSKRRFLDRLNALSVVILLDMPSRAHTGQELSNVRKGMQPCFGH